MINPIASREKKQEGLGEIQMIERGEREIKSDRKRNRVRKRKREVE